MYSKERHCRGVIERGKPLSVIIDDGEVMEVFACSKCRRLYFANGQPVLNKRGAHAKIIGKDIAVFLLDA